MSGKRQRLCLRDRVVEVLRLGRTTSRDVSAELAIPVHEASAYLCNLRRQGIAEVVALEPSHNSRDINIWALAERNVETAPTGGHDMSGQNPIKIRPEYTNRTCLGPGCRGKKMFRSAGPGNRMCPNCKAQTRSHDAQEVAREVQGWRP